MLEVFNYFNRWIKVTYGYELNSSIGIFSFIFFITCNKDKSIVIILQAIRYYKDG